MDKHLRSDGNGGYVISKKAITLIVTVIAIISFSIGIISSVMALNTDFTIMKEDLTNIKESNEYVHPVVIQNKEDIAVMTETLHRIDINIQMLVNNGG